MPANEGVIALARVAEPSAAESVANATKAARSGRSLIPGRIQAQQVSRDQVRDIAKASVGVAALVLWMQLTTAPVIYPQSQLLYYPTSLFLALSLILVAVVRLVAGGRFPRASYVVAMIAAAVASGLSLALGMAPLPAQACLFVECLGTAVLVCGWADSGAGRSGAVVAPTLLTGVLLAAIAYLALQAAGVTDAVALQSGFIPSQLGLPVRGVAYVAGMALTVALPVLSCVLLLVSSWPEAQSVANAPARAGLSEAADSLLPRGSVALLVCYSVLCSVFIGMNTNPFIINSRSLEGGVVAVAAVVCALLFVLSWLRFRPSPFVLLIVGAAGLCAGLLIFGMGLGSGFVRPLGLVCLAAFLFKLLMTISLAEWGAYGTSRFAVPLFLVVSGACLSGAGEQFGLWLVARFSLGNAQVALFGLIAFTFVAVATACMVAYRVVLGKRQADAIAEDALAAEAAAIAESEQARIKAERAQANAVEKSRIAQEAAQAAEAAARAADEAMKAAEQARMAEEAAKEHAAQQAARALAAEEAARERAAADAAAGGKHVVEVTFETSAEEDARLGDYFEERGLSARETDVMKLVAKRYPNNAIAEKLFISERTVKFHITNSYRKLDLHSRSELVLAIEAYMNEKE